jgi:hypothetical protein
VTPDLVAEAPGAEEIDLDPCIECGSPRVPDGWWTSYCQDCWNRKEGYR